MPYIEAKLSIELNDSQKDELQAKLVQAVSSAFSKPNAYIMTNIEDEKSLYMGGKKVEKGAYIEVKALGTVAKPSCQTATKTICDEIKVSYDITYIVKYFATLTLNAKFDYNKNDTEITERKQAVRLLQTPQRQNKIIIQGERNYDMNLIQALIKSFWYNKLGAERRLPPEARNGNNKRLRKLRFLPPEIIESIMNGTQDPELNVKKLIAIANEHVK